MDGKIPQDDWKKEMMIPYVIDNQKYKLSDILNTILENHQGQSMDVVTAYFNIQGYSRAVWAWKFQTFIR